MSNFDEGFINQVLEVPAGEIDRQQYVNSFVIASVSEAIQGNNEDWIASSQVLLAMTSMVQPVGRADQRSSDG